MWRFLRNRRLILYLHRPTIFRALTYWAHRAVILAIAWFPCLLKLTNVWKSYIMKKEFRLYGTRCMITSRFIVAWLSFLVKWSGVDRPVWILSIVICHILWTVGIVCVNIALQPSNDSLLIQLTPSVYQQCEATLSLLRRYRWRQFAVVTGSMPGHVYFVDVLRDLIEKNADDGW